MPKQGAFAVIVLFIVMVFALLVVFGLGTPLALFGF